LRERLGRHGRRAPLRRTRVGGDERGVFINLSVSISHGESPRRCQSRRYGSRHHRRHRLLQAPVGGRHRRLDRIYHQPPQRQQPRVFVRHAGQRLRHRDERERERLRRALRGHGAAWLARAADCRNRQAATVPRVAAFPGQKGVLAWADAGQVDYSTFTIGAGWAKQSTVGTLVSTTVSDLQVAGNSTSAAATWLQAVGSVNNVYSSIYNGSAWTTPALVSDGSHTAVDGAGHTPVGIDGQGNAFSVWFQGASTQPDIMFSRYASASGTWSTPSKIATATGTVGYLQVAVSDNGVAVVAWSVGTLV